jgi:hypothetical protein
MKWLLLSAILAMAACQTAPGPAAPATTVDSGQQEGPGAPQPAATTATPTYDTYCNARFGYCVAYPAGLLYPQPESGNGDGRVFKSKDGANTLTVWGRLNQDVEGNPILLETQYDEDLQTLAQSDNGVEKVITYQKCGKTFFVISGYEGPKIFYQKTVLKGDVFAYALLEYQEAEKERYNPVSDSVFASFR